MCVVVYGMKEVVCFQGFFFFIVKIKTFTIKYIFTEHNVDKLREHLQ